ncbi:MAG: hypothetical protein IJW50_02930 [Clostridia bacterium]|nr:hypothetical protein [Clostridia bacterium]
MEKVINGQFQKIQKYPHYEEIERRTRELAERIHYPCDKLPYLIVAFCRTKLSEGEGDGKGKNYVNDAMATLGDAVLRLVLTEKHFLDGMDKSQITNQRIKQECNNCLYGIAERQGWIDCLYHETHFYGAAPKNNAVSAGKHDSCVEAMICAFYLSGDFIGAKRFIQQYIELQEEEE